MVEVFWLLLIGARRIVAASSDFDNALFASDVLLKKISNTAHNGYPLSEYPVSTNGCILKDVKACSHVCLCSRKTICPAQLLFISYENKLDTHFRYYPLMVLSLFCKSVYTLCMNFSNHPK